MNLLAIRNLNEQDPLGGLGKKVTQAPLASTPPKDRPLPHAPHIVERPDGKLETAIPENAKAKLEARRIAGAKFIAESPKFQSISFEEAKAGLAENYASIAKKRTAAWHKAMQDSVLTTADGWIPWDAAGKKEAYWPTFLWCEVKLADGTIYEREHSHCMNFGCAPLPERRVIAWRP